MTENKVKLNIGCGLDFKPDYLNIDAQDLTDAVPLGIRFEKSDCNKLSFIPDRSVDEIYANQLLEHIHPLDIKEILAEWRRVLKIGATLVVIFPDFEKVIKEYENCKGLSTVFELMQFLELNYVTLCSSQGARVNTAYPHKSLLTTNFVSVLLRSEGFEVALVNEKYADRRLSTEIVAVRVLRD